MSGVGTTSIASPVRWYEHRWTLPAVFKANCCWQVRSPLEICRWPAPEAVATASKFWNNLSIDSFTTHSTPFLWKTCEYLWKTCESIKGFTPPRILIDSPENYAHLVFAIPPVPPSSLRCGRLRPY